MGIYYIFKPYRINHIQLFNRIEIELLSFYRLRKDWLYGIVVVPYNNIILCINNNCCYILTSSSAIYTINRF